MRYDRSTKTLIFSGFTGVPGYYVGGYGEKFCVYAEEDLTVTGTANFTINVSGPSYGIASAGVLTIAEGADLTINVQSDALEGYGGVIINGGRVDVTGRLGTGISATSGDGLVMNGGTVKASGGCFGIDAQNSSIVVKGGTLSVFSSGEDDRYAGIRLLSGGTINVKGGVLASGSHCSISYAGKWLEHESGDWYTGTVGQGKTYYYNLEFMPDDGYTFGGAGTGWRRWNPCTAKTAA